jgi:hypothetical protein
MAGSQIPGSLGMGRLNYETIDEGTLTLGRTPLPGVLGREPANKATSRSIMFDAKIIAQHKEIARQSIIDSLRRAGLEFKTRADWNAKEPASKLEADWNYHSIAIHHAGNDFSCSATGVDELRKAESIDINSFGHVSYHYAIDCQGVIYEALDIRCKGAHIEGGNTGVIGLVFLTDFSSRGEAEKYGPGVENVMKKRGVIAGVKEWIGVQKDKLDVVNDRAYDDSVVQLNHTTEILVKTLIKTFNIKSLGGHREFAKTHGTSRACPGVHGLIVADMLRKKFGLLPPS